MLLQLGAKKAIFAFIVMKIGWLASGSLAAVIPIASHIGDYEAQRREQGAQAGETVASQPAAVSLRAGVVGSNGSRLTASAVLVFSIPEMPLGEVITSATLQVRYQSETYSSTVIKPVDANLDLYLLPYDEVPVGQDPDRVFTGPLDAAPGVFLIQDDLIRPATPQNTLVQTSPLLNESFGQAIQAQFDAGMGTGDFIVLRLSYDDATLDLSTANRYIVTSGDSTNVTLRPTLTLTTAPLPEPAMAGVAAFVALVLARRIRRQ